MATVSKIVKLATPRKWLLGFAFIFSTGIAPSALAHSHSARHGSSHIAARHSHGSTHFANAERYGHSRLHYAEQPHHLANRMASNGRRYLRYASAAYRHSHAAARYMYSGLQCVPYAREVSHIELSGNAFLWWAEAAGRYARGNAPAEGAVLNFRAVGRMPLGHVAVVTAVLDDRTILVTQANWVRGTITNDVTVRDTSPGNDWSQVQVELGDTPTMGASYPVYGFIYNQPDTGTVIASSNAQNNEVAEAPRAVTLQTDAPDRNLQ